jgi:signal transduction histidine kinase
MRAPSRGNRRLLAVVGASLLFAALALSLRFRIEAPSLRATIETGLTLCGFVSVAFIWPRWRRTRRGSDLLVLAALLTMALQDFEFVAAPAMLGSRSSAFGPAAWPAARIVAAVLFALAAFTPRGVLVRTRRDAFALIAAAIGIPAALGVLSLAEDDVAAMFPVAHADRLFTAQTAITVAAIGVLAAAAVRFVRTALRVRTGMMVGTLGSALVLLGAGWLYTLLEPDLKSGSVSGHEALRGGAYVLVLVVALLVRAQEQRAETYEAAARERHRLARDLHDGMAQDLAFIAAHGERLARELGPEHPIAVAARRALAASRGAIIDLSAASAPNAEEALRLVAEELSTRHGVHVCVDADGEDVAQDDREDVVRIAREAIVNAVQHGGANHVSVELHARDGHVMLRIGDDGRGLDRGLRTDSHDGYGLRAMHERAQALGGELVVRAGQEGGTAVELLVP